jgi:hypothetical protein
MLGRAAAAAAADDSGVPPALRADSSRSTLRRLSSFSSSIDIAGDPEAVV